MRDGAGSRRAETGKEKAFQVKGPQSPREGHGERRVLSWQRVRSSVMDLVFSPWPLGPSKTKTYVITASALCSQAEN